MGDISARRQQVLDFITQFLREKGYSPSVRDVALGCGISSSSVAQYHLKILEKEGYIRRGREISRSIGLARPAPRSARRGVPLLGTIAAGQPIPVPAADTWANPPEATLELPRGLVPAGRQVYALRVKGHSMVDALIGDGDIVLLEPADTADDGEMVAVWLKDRQEVTLKKLYREPGRVCLKPANQTMQPIYVAPENVTVQGKVVGVIRVLPGA